MTALTNADRTAQAPERSTRFTLETAVRSSVPGLR